MLHKVLTVAISSSLLFQRAQAQEEEPQQFPEVPLAEKRFEYDQLPYKVDTDNLLRGPQHGYNICNSTTEGPESLCQTAIVNSLDDFCIWSAPDPNSMIGDIEGESVAWCTKPGYGTRLIPDGAIRGLQFTRTPDYIQVVGYIDQTLINLTPDDYGGEMDPHGADLRGNPMGGVLFSNAFTGEMQQVIEWHNFVGSNYFCMKACDPAGPDAAHYCEHIFDRIGCAYNAPSNAQEGEYTSCDGDSQLFPGIYVDEAGTTQTYTQPPESLGPITTMPYTAVVPASSNCQTFSSAQLFTALPSPSQAPAGNTATSSTGTGTGAPTASSTAGSTRTGTASGAASTEDEPNGALRQFGSASFLALSVMSLVLSQLL